MQKLFTVLNDEKQDNLTLRDIAQDVDKSDNVTVYVLSNKKTDKIYSNYVANINEVAKEEGINLKVNKIKYENSPEENKLLKTYFQMLRLTEDGDRLSLNVNGCDNPGLTEISKMALRFANKAREDVEIDHIFEGNEDRRSFFYIDTAVDELALLNFDNPVEVLENALSDIDNEIEQDIPEEEYDGKGIGERENDFPDELGL